MPLTESPQQQAMRELGEIVCPVCGASKRRKQSFCSPCYVHLPLNMQHGLWKSFGHGYEENYHEAKDWLLQERKAKGIK
jgi:hypothetical protein